MIIYIEVDDTHYPTRYRVKSTRNKLTKFFGIWKRYTVAYDDIERTLRQIESIRRDKYLNSKDFKKKSKKFGESLYQIKGLNYYPEFKPKDIRDVLKQPFN